MINEGEQACFMKDKRGFLPAHVACSRHCSPEKLGMLLKVNPSSLFDKTNDGDTLLSLAKRKATKAHPNYALIDELNKRIDEALRITPRPTIVLPLVCVSSGESSDSSSRGRLGSDDSSTSWQEINGNHNNDRSVRVSIDAKEKPTREVAVRRSRGKRKSREENPADLLLHFSRNGSSRGSPGQESPSKIAQV